MSYCKFVSNLPLDNVHRVYHDQHYGFEVKEDNALFERLVLEINQAGLSWDTILKKQENFKKAYDNFKLELVANYGDQEIERLLNDVGIIRNKLKINAAIYNAQMILKLQQEFGSFYAWIHSFGKLSKEEWVKIFKKNFKFTGGEIVNEFLMSIGVLDGAHEESCPIFSKIHKNAI